jgi:hypothetical protein
MPVQTEAGVSGCTRAHTRQARRRTVTGVAAPARLARTRVRRRQRAPETGHVAVLARGASTALPVLTQRALPPSRAVALGPCGRGGRVGARRENDHDGDSADKNTNHAVPPPVPLTQREKCWQSSVAPSCCSHCCARTTATTASTSRPAATATAKTAGRRIGAGVAGKPDKTQRKQSRLAI